jgi:hypothetical protein
MHLGRHGNQLDAALSCFLRIYDKYVMRRRRRRRRRRMLPMNCACSFGCRSLPVLI